MIYRKWEERKRGLSIDALSDFSEGQLLDLLPVALDQFLELMRNKPLGRLIHPAITVDYDSMKDDVYNCGHESMNYSKEEVALLIKERIPYYLHFAEVGKDEDQRNYEVSYEKIRGKGFNTSITVQDGIDELLRALETVEIRNPMSNV